MLFDPELFDPPLFAEEEPASVARIVFTLEAPGRGSASYNAPRKDPSDIEDYGLDCDRWLGSETIATRAAVADSSALTISGLDDAGGTVSFRASGGDVGVDHVVTVTVTSSTGRRIERSIVIPVRQL